MYKQLFYALVTTALLLSHRASATNFFETLATVEVPFAFQVAGKSFPAGKYVVRREPQMPQVLQIESFDKRHAAMIHARPIELSQPAKQGALHFNGYGEQRFLSEVRAAGQSVKYALTPTKDESRLAKTMKPKDISALPHGSPSRR